MTLSEAGTQLKDAPVSCLYQHRAPTPLLQAGGQLPHAALAAFLLKDARGGGSGHTANKPTGLGSMP